MTEFLIGIDVGTSASKALIVRASDGVVVASHSMAYPLSSPQPLWSEQDPADWWKAGAGCVRRALEEAEIPASRVAAVGLTGQMHGLVLIDDEGAVIRPAILWNDQRTAAECETIHARINRERMIAIAGKPALPSFTAPKILWVREHEPESFRSAIGMLLPKDFVRFRLTGNLATDVADASGTCLLDVRQRAWSDEVVDALDVPRDWLPRVCESPEVCARVSADGARQTGLLEGTPVVAGAGDQAAEAVGCGVVDDGQVAVTIGTSGVVFAATQQMRIDPDGGLHAYCHAAPDRWHVMGVMLSAGGSLQWYRETFCPDESLQAATHGGDAYERLINEASRVRPGCEGLTFLPYLTGERTPHADPYARGVFFGLTRRHEKAHLTRAVLEGVTFGLRDALELARSAGITPAFIRVSGGGTRSDLWRRMLADVFDHEIATVNATQGAAYGAALLAGVGAGTHASVGDACRCTVQETGTTCPTNPAAYRAAYRRYRSLYPALAPIFRSLAADS